MTVAQFFGCAMIAFGPPVVLFIVTMAKDPIRVIMLFASSFFWLLSLLFSSILYRIVPLQSYLAFGALFSVLFQELFRFLWFLLIQKAEVGLKKVSGDDLVNIENKHILAYVSGLGFGLISGAFSLVNVLADMAGPGTIGLRGDPGNFFVATTFTSLAFILLHVCWGVIFFNALHKKSALQLVYVIGTHLGATALTLLNPLYSVTVPLVWLILLMSALIAFSVAGASLESLRNIVKLKDRSFRVNAQGTRSSSRPEL